jgi:hypothetical protein
LESSKIIEVILSVAPHLYIIMADEPNEPITIKVKDATGDEMQFKVKKNTRMEKIFEAYAGK